MTVIRKTNNNSCWQGCTEIGMFLQCWGYLSGGTSAMENCQFLKMLSIKLMFDPEIPYLGLYLREMKTNVHTKIVHGCL